MVVREFNPEMEVNVAAKTHEIEDAMVAFTETDFVGYLLLGNMELAGLHVLCQDAQNDESGHVLSSPPGDGTPLAHD